MSLCTGSKSRDDMDPYLVFLQGMTNKVRNISNVLDTITLFISITMFSGTENIIRNIPYSQFK